MAYPHLSDVQLCKNNCGFFSSTKFDGLCSKCFVNKIYREKIETQTIVDGLNSIDDKTIVEIQSINVSNASNSSLKMLSEDQTASLELVNQNLISIDRTTIPFSTMNKSPLSNPTVSDVKNIFKKSRTLLPLLNKSNDSLKSMKIGDELFSSFKKPAKLKCDNCTKRAGVLGYLCHCGKRLCTKCRYSNEHRCQFDYKETGRKELLKQNPKVEADRINNRL
ncbi:unnamed protein product [Didymodactylos carnosus]|uniref:A20-type domain-containing protein n=1 Tax=Didymodactylos carnosus TaxID=1234261 RepID=A0A814SR66_9BILA|nr:unnamed protein product [Didymodactylos carnosus]CAF1540328.1 unnamed protein product [Didymodactylos carnosus]CAF3914992.1 unnamed protein product [Didymodactylos carnosus]CAF4328501.1 unnamed protein product [Didymodactylos carnosus]